MSFSDPVDPIEPSIDKWWITDLNTSSVKSPFAVRFTLVNQPNNLPEIKEWLRASFSSGCKFKEVNGFIFAEIFFRNDSDSTAFVLKWGDSFT